MRHFHSIHCFAICRTIFGQRSNLVDSALFLLWNSTNAFPSICSRSITVSDSSETGTERSSSDSTSGPLKGAHLASLTILDFNLGSLLGRLTACTETHTQGGARHTNYSDEGSRDTTARIDTRRKTETAGKTTAPSLGRALCKLAVPMILIVRTNADPATHAQGAYRRRRRAASSTVNNTCGSSRSGDFIPTAINWLRRLQRSTVWRKFNYSSNLIDKKNRIN